MNKTEIAIAAGAVTIVVLGVKLRNRNRKINDLTEQYNKLAGWGTIAQKLMRETIANNPELNLTFTTDLAVDLQFYDTMYNEKLL